MGMPIPVKMRRAALSTYERGEGDLADIARIFGVSIASLKRWRALERAGEPLEPLPHSGGRATQKIFEEHRDALRAWLDEDPDLFNRELAEKLREAIADGLAKITLAHMKAFWHRASGSVAGWPELRLNCSSQRCYSKVSIQ